MDAQKYEPLLSCTVSLKRDKIKTIVDVYRCQMYSTTES